MQASTTVQAFIMAYLMAVSGFYEIYLKRQKANPITSQNTYRGAMTCLDQEKQGSP